MVLHLAPEAMVSAQSAGSSQGKVLFFVIKTIMTGAGTRVSHKCRPNRSTCLDEIQNKAFLSAPSIQSHLGAGLHVPADRRSTRCTERQGIKLSYFLFLAGKPPLQA